MLFCKSGNGVLYVSGLMVGCMVLNAHYEIDHGKAVGNVHLITSAPLVASTATFTGVINHHHDTIIEAVYPGVADSRSLPHDGVTHPST